MGIISVYQWMLDHVNIVSKEFSGGRPVTFSVKMSNDSGIPSVLFGTTWPSSDWKQTCCVTLAAPVAELNTMSPELLQYRLLRNLERHAPREPVVDAKIDLEAYEDDYARHESGGNHDEEHLL